MNILVLNGSPKGENSVTLQYVRYLAKHNPNHTFESVHIAQRIRVIEQDPAEFEKILAQVRAADGVIWSFPLYYMLVHAHYKRFIELIFERGAQAAFAGKYAAAISTSIHYFDHTAHRYIHAICDDLGMRLVESFSPDMHDLFNEKDRRQLERFGSHFLQAIEKQVPVQRMYPPVVHAAAEYQPGPDPRPVELGGRKVAVIYDGLTSIPNLSRMLARLQSAFGGQAVMVNLREVEMKSSCIGCIKCGIDNECAFEGKDGYIPFFRETIFPADILIFAGEISDRYLSSRWKMFFDRSFFNTHTPVMAGKQLGFVISGPLGQIPNLSEIFQAYSELQGANLVGFVSDEEPDEIDQRIDHLAAQAAGWAIEGYQRPPTFLGMGGMKIFRDDIYGRLRPVFQADHRYYKKKGFYKTFPQFDLRTRLLNLFLVPLLNIPPIKKGFQKQMVIQMAAPAKKIAD